MRTSDTRYNSAIWSDTVTPQPRNRERHAPEGVTVHTIGNESRSAMRHIPGAEALSRKLVKLFKGGNSNRSPERLKVQTTYLRPGETVRLRDGTTMSYLPYSPPYHPWPTWSLPNYYGGTSGFSFGNEIRNWANWLGSSPLSMPWPTWGQPNYYGGTSGFSFGNEIRNWANWLGSSPLSYGSSHWNGPQVQWSGGWHPAPHQAWQPAQQRAWQGGNS